MQILTVVLSTVGTFGLVVIGLIYNNHRMNDLRDVLRAEMREVGARVDLHAKAQFEGLRRVEEVMDARLKHIEEEISRR